MQLNEWAWSFLLRFFSAQMHSDLSKIQHLWRILDRNIRLNEYQRFLKKQNSSIISVQFSIFFWLCEFLIFLICIAITLCHFPLFLVHKFFTCLPYDLTHCSRFVHSFQIGVFREKHFGSKMQLGQTKKTHRVKIIIQCIQERGLFLLA